jgi:hypothetical protein
MPLRRSVPANRLQRTAQLNRLAWLEDRSFEWDMYVDCRRVKFATAFAHWQTQQHLSDGSLMRRKGEPSSAAIDRGWPHQVVLEHLNFVVAVAHAKPRRQVSTS